MTATPQSSANQWRAYAPASTPTATKPEPKPARTLVIRNEGYEKRAQQAAQQPRPRARTRRLTAAERLDRAAAAAAEAFIREGGMSL